MSELYFRVGKLGGFTASNLADKREGYAIPIRELLQNSLDASREAGNAKCEINIHIETISKSDIPHIDEYEDILGKAINTQKNENSFNANAKRVANTIKEALKEEKISVLMFSDNGTGMPPNKIEAIFDERSVKDDNERSGGSYGVGHLSCYSLSSLRYVLYATKYRNKGDTKIRTLYTGAPILAGHQDEKNAQREGSGRIVVGKPEKPEEEMNPKFSYPEEFPSFVKPKMEALERGTMVAILGLSEKWDEDAEYAIASNFFHAIVHEELNVSIFQKNHPEKSISYDEAERLIESRKEEQRKKGENVLSGKAVYQAWQTVVDGTVNTNNSQKIKSIKLSNSDKVHVCIKNDRDATSVVVLVRNGMVVARHDTMLSHHMDRLRNDSSFEPFTAVIDIDQTDAPKLFKLVKGAEGPYHNKLTKILDKSEDKKLRDLFKELSEKIKNHLQVIERDSFDLPLFSVSTEDATEIGGNNNKSRGQSKKGKKQKKTDKPPERKVHKKIKRKGRTSPTVINRNLESVVARKYTDRGDKWDVQLRITPINEEDIRDEVYLSICIAEDSDDEKSNIYLDFRSIEMNGERIKILESTDQVKLGKLKKGAPYNIIAEIEKPNDAIGNMKVSLLPVIGLKRQNT